MGARAHASGVNLAGTPAGERAPNPAFEVLPTASRATLIASEEHASIRSAAAAPWAASSIRASATGAESAHVARVHDVDGLRGGGERD